jgi:hypothetical protein
LGRRSGRGRGTRWRNIASRFLLALFEDRPGDVARLVHLRPVDLRLNFGLMAASRRRNAAAPEDMRADALRLMLFNRAGVRLLFSHADCRQSIQNFFALDFQLTR